MLAKMFSGEFAPGTKDEQGAYLLDQNPKYFEPILDYLRTRKLINDPNVSMDGVLAVAEFFGIHSLVDQIEELKQAENYLGRLVDISCHLTRISSDLGRIANKISPYF